MRRLLRSLRDLLLSSWLWTLVGLVLLAALIWTFGPLFAVGEARPLEDEVARLVLIALLVAAWLVSQIVAWRRAARANRLFVAEIAAPPPKTPGDEALEVVESKFQSTLDELKRRKLGRRFLRDMPWYVIIGPPATGKTTALKQAGLSFPLDLHDDLHGIGGTRNCDWFFTEDAVLIDTAGRYTEQASAPDADAREWLGFLDLLKKHRGPRALNGVIVALSVDALASDETTLRAHGRTIRKRLGEIMERLESRLPVYLMLTKADLIRGFEPVFANLTNAEREQVWGATFPASGRVSGTDAARELELLSAALERRLAPRLEAEERLPVRAEIFRFPAQLAAFAEPLRVLFDTIFGESRYETSAWPRGIYLTSATQEGTPLDRLTGALASSFGLPAQPSPPPPRTERRSFFLKDLLVKVVFGEAGLATLDPAAEERRIWTWRAAALGAATVFVLAALVFTLSYITNRNALSAQAAQLDRLRVALAPAAARQVPVDPLDLDAAQEAMATIEAASTSPADGVASAIGPSVTGAILRAQEAAYNHGLRNLLEPRMVALLEATMWREIRDPDFLLDALKVYRMMTGLSQMDPDFARAWWANRLPERAPVNPFPTEVAATRQLDALARLAYDGSYPPPDEALVAQALEAICEIPLPRRAYNALVTDPAATALPEWVPAVHAGPNGARVLTRFSGRTLRVGIPGIYTYAGFHDVVLERLEDVAAQAALDRSVYTGGCRESAEASVTTLAEDMLKLYYDDFIDQWEGLLRDITLAPLTDLRIASENLKDLASADSAMRRLVTAIVAETDLARPRPEETAASGPPAGAGRLLSKLGRVGKLAKQGAAFIPTGGGVAAADTSGQPVSNRFRPIRAAVEQVDGQPPGLDDAQAALAALSNMLQTVAASPSPEEALRRQGGLSELVGAVANEAARLPDPLDDWLLGIMQDWREREEEAILSQLNAIWRADILPFCQAATAGRYPFAGGSTIDVNTADFARLFGRGGMIDTFTNEHLLRFIDATVRPWRWRADLALDHGALAPFERARRIQEALFPGGVGPALSFTLAPVDLSAATARVSLNIDGQLLSFAHGASRPQQMTWPGREGTGMITLAFSPLDGSPEIMVSETGAWAFLRLIRANRLSATSLPELYHLRLSARGHHADFELRAASVENPFDLQMFGNFQCPARI